MTDLAQLSFSPWDMFLNAGLVVRCVMILLVVASVLTWTIFVAKSAELLRARRTLTGAEKALEDANTLDLGEEWTRGNASIAHTLVMAAEIERKRSQDISDDGEGATTVGIWKTLVKMVHGHAPSQGSLQRNLNLLVEYGVLHRDVGAD